MCDIKNRGILIGILLASILLSGLLPKNANAAEPSMEFLNSKIGVIFSNGVLVPSEISVNER